MERLFKEKSVIPVVSINDPFEVDDHLLSLYNGGMRVAEIMLRGDNSLNVLHYAIEKMGRKMLIGAGTVLNKNQAQKAVEFGAKFIVSPGFSKEVFEVCKKADIPYLPGAETATEIMEILKNGISIIKFYPAELCGGINRLKAYKSVFRNVKFIPMGGITEENLPKYLKEDNVFAVCASFMMRGTNSDIVAHTKNTVNIVKKITGK